MMNIGMKIYMIILFLVYSQAVVGQERALKQNTVEFILETYHVPEVNPTHEDASSKVDSAFKAVLIQYAGLPGSENDVPVSDLFNLLYANGSSGYEDSPDIRRMKMRRSMCFSAIALKSDIFSSITFLDHAEYSLMYKCPEKVEPLLETEYCGLLFLELLVRSDLNKDVFRDALFRIEQFLDEQGMLLPDHVREEAGRLVVAYQREL